MGNVSLSVYPAGPPREGEWVLEYRTETMPCSAFLYFKTQAEALAQAGRMGAQQTGASAWAQVQAALEGLAADAGRGYFITGLDAALSEAYCFGWFSRLEQAREAIEANATDLTDGGVYRYVVIEEIPAGFYRYDGAKHWYAWDEKAERFISCCPPRNLDPGCTLYAFTGYVIRP